MRKVLSTVLLSLVSSATFALSCPTVDSLKASPLDQPTKSQDGKFFVVNTEAHDADGNGPGARKAIAGHGEHGWPEERFADGVDGQGEHGAHEGGDRADEVEPNAGEGGANQEDADRRQLQLLLDEVRSEAEAEHNG